MIQSVSSSLAAQEEKREKNSPTPPEIAKMWTIFFFGAAIPPSPSRVDDKARTFAIMCKAPTVSSKKQRCKVG